jgi:hypothetical protein
VETLCALVCEQFHQPDSLRDSSQADIALVVHVLSGRLACLAVIMPRWRPHVDSTGLRRGARGPAGHGSDCAAGHYPDRAADQPDRRPGGGSRRGTALGPLWFLPTARCEHGQGHNRGNRQGYTHLFFLSVA